jgi:hypothetical protein
VQPGGGLVECFQDIVSLVSFRDTETGPRAVLPIGHEQSFAHSRRAASGGRGSVEPGADAAG